MSQASDYAALCAQAVTEIAQATERTQRQQPRYTYMLSTGAVVEVARVTDTGTIELSLHEHLSPPRLSEALASGLGRWLLEVTRAPE